MMRLDINTASKARCCRSLATMKPIDEYYMNHLMSLLDKNSRKGCASTIGVTALLLNRFT